jgi:hypothetical protein
MEKKYLLMIGVGLGAILLGRKLYQIRQNNARIGHETDTVDMSSEDSFPASDAPSWTPVTSARPVA